MESNLNAVELKYRKWIIVLSVAIPVVVAILFGVKLKDFGYDVEPLSFLPPIYATINGITAVLVPVNQPLASLLAQSGDWHVVYKDQVAILFQLSSAGKTS